MKLSVVMCVYNDERFLAPAIESILTQTYRDFEFIIIDDGSTDKTSEILDDYSRRDGRITCVTLEQNCGLPHAINVGIEKASGSLIARMDSDDVSMADRFEQQVKYIATSGVDVLGTYFLGLKADGTAGKIGELPTTDDAIKYTLPYGNCIIHPSVMMKKSALEAAGNYDEGFLTSQDYDLWLRMMPSARMGNIGMPLLGFRKYNNRINLRKNKSRQTRFSVCGAQNHFRTAYGLDRLSPNADIDTLIRSFSELCQNDLSQRERQCLNQHITRFARRCILDQSQRHALKDILFRSATLAEKNKWVVQQFKRQWHSYKTARMSGS